MQIRDTKQPPTIRNSTAEFLIFIASVGKTPQQIEIRYENENIRLTQKLMASLYDVDVRTINYHIKKIFEDKELTEQSVIQNFRITANDGKNYETKHYSLQMIVAVGFKVNNERAVQFRRRANQILKDYTIKGYVMDEERFKKGWVLTDQYFEEQLEKIREIRVSERKFYQKITDIYATSLDYDVNSIITLDFFKKVQNKLHWAIHHHTAAELITRRANAEKEHMWLETRNEAPYGKIKKSDVVVAKNYLEVKELKELELLVAGYLDFAENMAKRKIPMTMKDWIQQLDQILLANKYELLQNAGTISMELAKQHAETEFEKYRIIQDRVFESDFDRFIEETRKMLPKK